jgi:hypothetical protein
MPEEVRNLVTFKAVGGDQTEGSVTEYDWPVGQMMEMSKMGMEQRHNDCPQRRLELYRARDPNELVR